MIRTSTALLSVLALAALPAGAQAAHRASRDSDHDGLSNRQELKLGTNAHKADTDGDGLKDGAEVRTGNDPLRRDTDGDGVVDGREHAGAIASFANGVLTIKMANGKTISGTVADTRVDCESAAEHAVENASHHQRGKAAKARAARNGQPSDSSGGSSSGGNNDAAETEPAENENEQEPAENEQQPAEAEHQNGNCSNAELAPGTEVHKAVMTNGVFTDVELVH